MAHSQSSRALDALLRRGGEDADAIRASQIHAPNLSRFRNGHTKPSIVTAILLERLSSGEVPANGWEDESTSGEHTVAQLPPDSEEAS